MLHSEFVVRMRFKIKRVQTFFVLFFLLLCHSGFTQEVVNKTLINADKLYITKDYSNAVTAYLMYLEKYPRDYQAER
jgi:TolA-binding protein